MSLTINPVVPVAAVAIVPPAVDSFGPILPETPAEVPFNDFEKNPSEWEILGGEEGIYARNNKTGRVFEGETLSFNALLRG